ncbi:hypothetical protein ACF0H5_015200 [Mactra antiquata]
MSHVQQPTMNTNIKNNNSGIDDESSNKVEDIDANLLKKLVENLSEHAEVDTEGRVAYEMKNFADGTRSSLGSESRRLDSEEFENISVSALDGYHGNEEGAVFKEFDNENIVSGKGISRIHKKKGKSVDLFEPSEEIIEEEFVANGYIEEVDNEGEGQEDFNVNDDEGETNGDGRDKVCCGDCSVNSENDVWMTGDEISKDRSMNDEDRTDDDVLIKATSINMNGDSFAHRIVTSSNHGIMSAVRRRSEVVNKSIDENEHFR